MDTKALLAREILRASQKAPDVCKTFLINGKACGTVMPRAFSYLERNDFHSRLQITPKTVELSLRSESPDEISKELASLAKELHAIGAFYQWRDELLDIFPAQGGSLLGRAERGLFRFLGFTTTCVHAIAKDAEGRFFVGVRSSAKQVDPNLLDTISGGLSSAGETPTETLARETYEEAGIQPDAYDVGNPFEFLVTRTVREGWMRERTVCYPVTLYAGISPHNIDGEVAEFRLLSRDEILEGVKEHRFTLDAGIAFLKVICHENSHLQR